jgi:probable HAF family extracellular repeat protein
MSIKWRSEDSMIRKQSTKAGSPTNLDHHARSQPWWLHLAATPMVAGAMLVGLTVLPEAAMAQTTYTVTAIPPFLKGSAGQSGTAINANGDIVGADGFKSFPDPNQGFPEHGMLVKAGTVKENDLFDLGDVTPPQGGGCFCGGAALGLNNADQVVGWSWTKGNNPNFEDGLFATQRPVLWQMTNGKFTIKDLGNFLDLSDVKAQGINSQGQIVGIATNSFGVDVQPTAWLWQNGVTTNLPTLGGTGSEAFAINDRGQIAGAAVGTNQGFIHAVIWQGTSVTDLGTLPGGLFSEAVAVNQNGVAVGVSTFNGGDFATGNRHAVLFQNGTVTDLTPINGDNAESFAAAINNHGQIVGGSLGHAFIWNSGPGGTDLNTLIPPKSGIILTDANGINDKGQIVAVGHLVTNRANETNVYLLTPKTSTVVGAR